MFYVTKRGHEEEESNESKSNKCEIMNKGFDDMVEWWSEWPLSYKFVSSRTRDDTWEFKLDQGIV